MPTAIAKITSLPPELLAKITASLPSTTTAFLRATCRTLYLLIPAPYIANLNRLYIMRKHVEEVEAGNQARWVELLRLYGSEVSVAADGGGRQHEVEQVRVLCGGCRMQHDASCFSSAQLASSVSARERRCKGREEAVRIAAGLKLYFSGAEKLLEALRTQRTMGRWVHAIAFGAGEGANYDGRYWVWERAKDDFGKAEEEEQGEDEVEIDEALEYPADATNPVFTLAEAKGELCVDNMMERSFTAMPVGASTLHPGSDGWEVTFRRGSADCLLCPHTSVFALVLLALTSSSASDPGPGTKDRSTAIVRSTKSPLKQPEHVCKKLNHTRPPHDKRFYRPWLSSDNSTGKMSGEDSVEGTQLARCSAAMQLSKSATSAASGPSFPFCDGPHIMFECEKTKCETVFYVDWLYDTVQGKGYGYNTARIYWTRSLGGVSGDAMDARWTAQLGRC